MVFSAVAIAQRAIVLRNIERCACYVRSCSDGNRCRPALFFALGLNFESCRCDMKRPPALSDVLGQDVGKLTLEVMMTMPWDS